MTDLSASIMDDKTKRLRFDFRNVSLSDILILTRNAFKNVDANRIVVEDNNKGRRDHEHCVYLSVREPLPQDQFVRHPSGKRSCRPSSHQTLGQMVEQAESVPNCDLSKVHLVVSGDDDRVLLYFDADCEKKQEPWVTTRQKPLFQPLGDLQDDYME